MSQTVTVAIPDDLYQRLTQIAEASQRPIERVLVETLDLIFRPFSPEQNIESELAQLPSYSDEQLWAVVYRRLNWSQSQRLQELSAKNKSAGLSVNEQDELDDLLELNDRAMLLRSEALLLLKKRGHNIETYLKRGA